MDSKFYIPFEIQMSEAECSALERYSDDAGIKKVVILPGFKLKSTTVGRGQKILRCDDTILIADRLDPELCDYQIGCGYLSFLLRLKNQRVNPESLEAVFKSFAEEGRSSLVNALLRAGNRRLPLQLKVPGNYTLPESITEDQFFPTIRGGIQAYLNLFTPRARYNFDARVFPRGSREITEKDYELVENLLSPLWIKGRGHRISDDLASSLSGSHYIDVARISSSNSDVMRPGDLCVNIHAHGANFNQLLVRGITASAKTLSRDALNVLIQLMNNQAAIQRCALALRLLRHFNSSFPDFEVKPIIDRPHRDVISLDQPASGYLYLNDSQILDLETSTLIPSGDPRGESYLVNAGANASRTNGGVCHNLKKIIGSDSGVEKLNRPVQLFEVQPTGLNPLSLGKGTNFRSKLIPGLRSSSVDELVSQFTGAGIFRETARMTALVRYHVCRRGEKALTETGLTR